VPHYPPVDGQQVIRTLEKFGFDLDRIQGSHHMMYKPGHHTVVPVPVHGRHTIPLGTLRSIIRLAGLTPAGFFEAL
jgi:predicted RNA binding protein YcfA (HicA-like mRNA interferase family)